MATDVFSENRELNKREIQERKIRLDSKPIVLGLILTNWCNLRCIMCCDTRNENSLTLAKPELLKIMELAPFLQRIEWQGGEFFHLAYVKEIFSMLKPFVHLENHITTNGLLLDEEWLQLFFDVNVTLAFSIDGPNPASYEYIRRGGKFETLIEKLETLMRYEKKHQKPIHRSLQVVVMKSNYKVLSEFGDFVKKYGFGELFVTPVQHIKSDENIFLDLSETVDEELTRAKIDLETQLSNTSIKLKWVLPTKIKSTERKKTTEKEAGSPAFFCGLPWQGLYVCAENKGQIFPDCWCTTPVGNIYEDRLLDVWNNEMMQDYRRRLSVFDRTLCSAPCRNSYSAQLKAQLVT